MSLSTAAAEYAAASAFAAFKAEFGKIYATVEEEATRFENFKATLEMVSNHNGTSLGITKFADLTPEEFSSQYLNYRPRDMEYRRTINVQQHSGAAVSASKDWVKEGATTPVKDQGYCGSCWAFSATQQIESEWALAGNPLTEFATEQLVQCDSGDGGCNGGDTVTAFDYVIKAGGLATEADYPYTSGNGRTGTCASSFDISGGTITGYTYATDACFSRRKCDDQDEDKLIANIDERAPVSICVDASRWQAYKGGIFDGSCGNGYNSLDHCVQLTGYANYEGSASSSSNGYYIVRNSWAEDWGEKGYIYLPMGENSCGVATEALFVDV